MCASLSLSKRRGSHFLAVGNNVPSLPLTFLDPKHKEQLILYLVAIEIWYSVLSGHGAHFCSNSEHRYLEISF